MDLASPLGRTKEGRSWDKQEEINLLDRQVEVWHSEHGMVAGVEAEQVVAKQIVVRPWKVNGEPAGYCAFSLPNDPGGS